MACLIHDRPDPCPQCEWADSGDPVLIRSAAARADRVAGRDHVADAGKLIAPPPSLSRQAATFAKAVARHVAAGLPIVSDEVKAARLAACGACDKLTPDGRCNWCGCGVAKKAAWEREKCPLDRWPTT